jgi:hypothetical protein
MKITVEELNLAYGKVLELKKTLDKPLDTIQVDLERNPLTDENFFNEDSEFVIPVKLTFKFLEEVGPSGSYVLADDNIEIVE